MSTRCTAENILILKIMQYISIFCSIRVFRSFPIIINKKLEEGLPSSIFVYYNCKM